MDKFRNKYRSMKMHQSPTKDGTIITQPESTEENEEDIISQAIGNFGKWQLKLTFLLSLFNIPCTWHIMAPTFQGAARNFWCKRPDHFSDLDPDKWVRISQPKSQCEIYNYDWASITLSDAVKGFSVPFGTNITKCLDWEYSGEGNTIISEWNLVCDQSEVINIAEMMFLAGVAIGGLVSGYISDRCGRKRTLLTCLVLQTLIAVSIAFTPCLILYFILRILLGFISVSIVFSGFVLAIELVGGKWRNVAGVSFLFPVPLGYIAISGIAYLIPDWRQLQLAISLPGLLLFVMYFILPESPRWLLTAGRKDAVMKILNEASKTNGRELPENIDKLLLVEISKSEDVNDEGKPGVKDLFKTKSMRKNTLCLFLIWFVVYLVYYGLMLNMANVGGDMYINTVLSGLVEIPAIAMSILFLHKGGRRWPLCLSMALSGIACLCTLPVPKDETLQWLTTTFTMMGKFSISSSNAMIPVFTAELFPTVIRNLGVGASNVSAGIALMLVPYLWNLTKMDAWVPMAVLGVFGIIGGMVVLLLPETANKPLSGHLQNEEETTPSDRTSKRISNQEITMYGTYSLSQQ